MVLPRICLVESAIPIIEWSIDDGSWKGLQEVMRDC